MRKERIFKFYNEHKKKLIPLILILTFLIVIFLFYGLRLPTLNRLSDKVNSELVMGKAMGNNCSLEYGSAVCRDERYYIPFYNPNNQSIRKVLIYAPKGFQGFNIYRASGNLSGNETGILRTSKCKGFTPNRFSLKWCCKECYKVKMTDPSSNLTVKPG